MVTSQSVQRLGFETPKFVFGDLVFDFITNPSVRISPMIHFLFSTSSSTKIPTAKSGTPTIPRIACSMGMEKGNYCGSLEKSL